MYGANDAPRSRVYVASDNAGWALGEEALELKNTLARLGLRVVGRPAEFADAVFHMNKGRGIRNLWLGEKLIHRKAGLSYYHGMPGSSEKFNTMFARLKRAKPLIDGVRVSTIAMENLMLNEGFESKVQRIPIGICISDFPFANDDLKGSAREWMGIPLDSVVVGSFQKDGEGWGDGVEPKLIKGPDIFVETVALLARKIPELFVLLAGPSRGYVSSRLEAYGVRHLNLGFVESSQVPLLYQAIDAYVISSREEGGPKAFLESFATGVPLISTPVGQVVDLADGYSAWIASSFEPSEIAELVFEALNSPDQESKTKRARILAQSLSHESLDPLWRGFFFKHLGVGSLY